MKGRMEIVLAVCLPLAMAGCEHGGEWSIIGGDRANIAGATTVVDFHEEKVKPRRIVAALGEPKDMTLDAAISDFDDKQVKATSLDAARPAMQKRDAAQDIIIMASQSRCGYYEEYLRRYQSDSASTFGILSTVLGGAGAIVTGADGARALSGVAGISSGVGAEIQKDVFANLTSTVIVPGIEKRRYDILTQIMNNRCYDASRYTVGMAIADAIAYHAACSMDNGVAEAGLAIKEASTPGSAGLTALMSAAQNIAAAQGEFASIAVNTKTVPASPPAPAAAGPQTVVTVPLTAARPNSGTPIPDCTKVNPDLWTSK